MLELEIILVFLLSASFLIDTGQVAIRILSGQQGAPLLGAHTAQVLLLLNRAAVACAMVILGYIIDNGIHTNRLLIIYTFISLIIAIFHKIIIKPRNVEQLNAAAMRFLHGYNVKKLKFHGNEHITSAQEFSFWPSLVFATIVNFLGLLGPSLLASQWPNFRATLMQTGFLINTAGTLVYVIYIEKEIALKMNSGTSDLNILFHRYVSSRTLSYSIISIFSILFYFIFLCFHS